MSENRNGYQPSPIGEPERTFADGRWTVILTRELRHPVDRVWAALTAPGQLRQWAPFTADRDLGRTGEVVMTMIDAPAEADSVEEAGAVLDADPPTLLIYRWGQDVLRWELTSTGSGTTLVLRHTLADEGLSSAVAAGWHLCLDVLDALLNGAPFGPVVGRHANDYGWGELNQRYAEKLGVKPSFS